MPQVPTSPDNKTAGKTISGGRPLLVPPEEQFWKRYSPHNEFPLSSATSVALHIIAIGLLLLVAILLWNRSSKPPDVPELVPVVLQQSGRDIRGDKEGGGRSGGNGGEDTKSDPEDVGNEDDNPREDGDPEAPALKDPPGDPAVELPSDPEGTRRIVQGKVTENLTDIGKKALFVLSQRKEAPKTRKGSKDKGGGSGGDKGKGRDKGRDKGTGNKKGTLEQKIQREKRQLRWRVLFNTRSGSDYQNQLYALRAILVVAEFQPGSNTDLMYRKVIRNLARSPARPRIEDVRKIQGIFWIDDKPESVQSLARALGLRPPPLFACFFPERVEDDLRKLEHAKYPGPENNINETIFRMVPSARGRYQGVGTRYNLVCDDVMLK
jgi:hypothetical protein